MKTLLLSLVAAYAWATVTPVSVSPSSGSGANRQFQFAYTATGGPSSIALMEAIFAPSSGQVLTCQVRSFAQTGQVMLYTDSGGAVTGWLGTSGFLDNGHCKVNLATSWQYATGTQALFAPDMTFTDNPVNVYGSIVDNSGTFSGWTQLGTWSLSGGGGSGITPVSASPASGSSTNQQFTMYYNSQGGPSAIGWLMASFGADPSACRVQSNAQTGEVRLYNENGTYISNWLGVSGTLQNGHCILDPATSWQYAAGTQAWFAPVITFTSGSSGQLNIYGNASNINGTTGNWATLGTWTVPTNMNTYTKADAVTSQLPTTDVGQTATIDALTGQPTLIPTSDHPPASINFMSGSVDWPDTLNMGDAFTVVIRNAKPNTQVWLLQINMQHLISPEPCITAPTVESCYLSFYWVLPNQGLLGTTDSNGYFAYSSHVPGSGGFYALQFWVVNSSTPPASADTFETSDTSANFLGAVSFFAAGQYNISVPVYQ